MTASRESNSRPLPVDDVLPDIVQAWRDHACAVLRAPTGAGKTTRVPPALLEAGFASSGAILLVQPRRLAARAAAIRIASERRTPLGTEVGYIVRFDARVKNDTRLIVMTEGILLRMLLDDPLLERAAAVIFDEFHERNLNSDLALGMTRRIQEALRPDLRIMAMSATLDPLPIAAYLGNCPAIESTGRLFPVDTSYLPSLDRRPIAVQAAEATERALQQTGGDVLVFLPGVGEIRQTERELTHVARKHDLAVMPLFGDLPAEQQDAVLLPGDKRKVVLATNVAETSLTIEGITAVVDSGLARVMRYDADVGLDRLELTPVSRASADQRAGRAGRLGPGICLRLWERRSHDRRAERETPEIRRLDLSGPLLQLHAWGERPREFPWYEPPDENAVEQGETLLVRLGALDDRRRITELGRRMARIPVQPRLARLLIAGEELGAANAAALAAALISERDPFMQPSSHIRSAAPRDERRGGRTAPSHQNRPPTFEPLRTDSDIVDRVAALAEFARTGRPVFADGELNVAAARHVLRSQRQLVESLGEENGEQETSGGPRDVRPAAETSPDDTTEFGTEEQAAVMRALLAAYPDRLARRRGPHDDRGVLCTGRGVKLSHLSGVKDAELFLCIDVDGQGSEARVRKASLVRREWLPAELLRTADEMFFHPTQKRVVARRRTYWDELQLDETNLAAEPGPAAASVLFRAALPHLDSLVADSAFDNFVRRLRFLRAAMPELELPRADRDQLETLLETLCAGALSFDDVERADWLGVLRGTMTYQQLAAIDREAPVRIQVPSGSQIALQYDDGRPPLLAVRIQEVFGWRETPRVAGGRVPLLLHLLAPNHRPQQVTDDLASFWKNTYPQVRKDLRARYPKHAWPEDPLAAEPESRPRRKK